MGGKKPGMTMDRVLMVVSALISLIALGIIAYLGAESRREFQRLATEIAEVRVSLQLFADRDMPASAPAGDSEALLNLSNRLAVVEEALNAGGGGTVAPSPFEAAPAPEASTTGEANGDCIPQSTRFLVGTGDIYPVCGAGADLRVAAVGASDLVLEGGGAIPAGASGVLPGTNCIVSVLAAGEALGGFAEVRIAC